MIVNGFVACNLQGTGLRGRCDAAKLVVVDQFSDCRIGAADRAVGILAQLQGTETHAQCIDQKQTADEGFPDAEDQLDGFGRLDDTEQARQDAEHAAFGTGGDEAGGRGVGIQVAVARAQWGAEDARLAFKPVDGGVGIGFAQEDAGVIDEVASLEVVGAVGNDVVVLKDLERVCAGEHGVVLDNVQVRVQSIEHNLRRVDFELPDRRGGVNDLALKVASVDCVEVNEADSAYSRGCKIHGKRSTQTAGADAEDLRGLQFLLAFHADLGQDEVAGVTCDLVV